MKFYNYLNEGRAKGITYEKAIELLKTDYSQAFNRWKKGNRIYRGAKWYGSPFNYINPGRGRKSRNTLNYYTLIVNNHSSWKEYPQRELICTTDDIEADSYGLIYDVFPINNAKVGICSAEDFWVSFIEGVSEINKTIVDTGIDRPDIDTMHDVNTWINRFLHTPVNTWRDLELQLKNTEYHNSGKSLYDIIIPALNPQKNDFSVESIKNFSTTSRKEVWLDKECLLIFNDFIFYNEKELINEVL